MNIIWCANGSASGMPTAEYYNTCSITPLPIKLIKFTGNRESDKVQLHWATATEINYDYFTIEKSIDGIHFLVVMQMEGVGNSSHINNNYYILRQWQIQLG